MNANTMRMAFGIYLVIALFTIPTVHAKSPIKALESRVTENEADISANSALIADHEARITTNESDINANSTLIDDNTSRLNTLPKTLVVLDSNDKKVGIATHFSGPASAFLFFDFNGRLIFLNITTERFVQGPVYYDQLNCLGTPHVILASEWMVENGFVRGTSVFRPIADTTPPAILRSQWTQDTGFEDGLCINTSRTDNAGILPAEVIFDISEFTPPFKYSVAP